MLIHNGICFFYYSAKLQYLKQIICKKKQIINGINLNLFIFANDMNTKAIKHIFTILFATYFLLVGVGYNVVNYCCNSCADAGIEMVAISSCRDVHHQEEDSCCEQESNDLTCENTNHLPQSCHLLRLNIDTPSIEIYDLTNAIFSIDLFYPLLFLQYEHYQLVAHIIIHPPESHFPSSGREILALNAVLLI